MAEALGIIVFIGASGLIGRQILNTPTLAWPVIAVAALLTAVVRLLPPAHRRNLWSSCVWLWERCVWLGEPGEPRDQYIPDAYAAMVLGMVLFESLLIIVFAAALALWRA